MRGTGFLLRFRLSSRSCDACGLRSLQNDFLTRDEAAVYNDMHAEGRTWRRHQPGRIDRSCGRLCPFPLDAQGFLDGSVLRDGGYCRDGTQDSGCRPEDERRIAAPIQHDDVCLLEIQTAG